MTFKLGNRNIQHKDHKLWNYSHTNAFYQKFVALNIKLRCYPKLECVSMSEWSKETKLIIETIGLPSFLPSCLILCIILRTCYQTLGTISSVQSLSDVRLFATPWIAARQASLSITNSQSLLKLMPIESVMPSSHLILCCPFLLLPPIPPSIRVFSSESTLCMRWP